MLNKWRNKSLQKARGLKNHVRGTMNKTEIEYAAELEKLRIAGEIEWYKFESVRFKVGQGQVDAWYTPDFAVMRSDGMLEMHEVKGFWLEAAKVRIKAAALGFPITFISVQKNPKKLGGGWKKEKF